jgi:hypothetical protein
MYTYAVAAKDNMNNTKALDVKPLSHIVRTAYSQKCYVDLSTLALRTDCIKGACIFFILIMQ